ncbi:hypothetical protein MSPP1_003650 [Malassezia sp. CBS 17886]|nr:hypothetical protein MSPP1_003650 [Malassezia sp. CBS 17886]
MRWRGAAADRVSFAPRPGDDVDALLAPFQEYIRTQRLHESYLRAVWAEHAGLPPLVRGDGAPALCSVQGVQADGYACNFFIPHNNTRLLALDALPPHHALVECYAACACAQGEGCTNRLVTRGPPTHTRVQTSASGLGLFADEPIARGAFVCEYAGEVVSEAEAERRWQARAQGRNYVMQLREWRAGGARAVQTCIDPSARGNMARFINHKCPPLANLIVLPVRCDPPLCIEAPGVRRPMVFAAPPRAALFAARAVAAGEELAFDYGGAGEEGGAGEIAAGDGRTPCLCGSPRCRGWLPFTRM